MWEIQGALSGDVANLEQELHFRETRKMSRWYEKYDWQVLLSSYVYSMQDRIPVRREIEFEVAE